MDLIPAAERDDVLTRFLDSDARTLAMQLSDGLSDVRRTLIYSLGLRSTLLTATHTRSRLALLLQRYKLLNEAFATLISEYNMVAFIPMDITSEDSVECVRPVSHHTYVPIRTVSLTSHPCSTRPIPVPSNTALHPSHGMPYPHLQPRVESHRSCDAIRRRPRAQGAKVGGRGATTLHTG
jgi:hypothetical protein